MTEITTCSSGGVQQDHHLVPGQDQRGLPPLPIPCRWGHLIYFLNLRDCQNEKEIPASGETFNQYQKSSVSAQAKSGLCGDRDDVLSQTHYENMFVMLSGTILLQILIGMKTSAKRWASRKRAPEKGRKRQFDGVAVLSKQKHLLRQLKIESLSQYLNLHVMEVDRSKIDCNQSTRPRA